MGNVAFIKILVEDLEAEADFYCEFFNMKRLEHKKMDLDGGVEQIMLGNGKPAGSVLILIHYQDGREAKKAGMLGFMNPDVDGLLDRLSATRAKIVFGPIDEPDGGKAVLISDPEGQVIEILQKGG